MELSDETQGEVMKRIRLIITVGMIVLCVGHTGVSQQPTVQNLDAAFWKRSHEWSEDAIWNKGIKPLASGSATMMAAKPANYTVTVSSGAVTVLSFKSNYQNPGTDWTPTLLVSTNFTIEKFLELGVQANGALIVTDGGHVSLRSGRSCFGAGGYSGALTVESGGIFECSGAFEIGEKGTVKVNGILKSLYPVFNTSLSISESGRLYIGKDGKVILRGDLTANGTLLKYISDGKISGAGEIKPAYDIVSGQTLLTAEQ
ncbi:MAG: hypothetical protein WC959_03195 [Kiritimatiellales bacterium]